MVEFSTPIICIYSVIPPALGTIENSYELNMDVDFVYEIYVSPVCVVTRSVAYGGFAIAYYASIFCGPASCIIPGTLTCHYITFMENHLFGY